MSKNSIIIAQTCTSLKIFFTEGSLISNKFSRSFKCSTSSGVVQQLSSTESDMNTINQTKTNIAIKQKEYFHSLALQIIIPHARAPKNISNIFVLYIPYALIDLIEYLGIAVQSHKIRLNAGKAIAYPNSVNARSVSNQINSNPGKTNCLKLGSHITCQRYFYHFCRLKIPIFLLFGRDSLCQSVIIARLYCSLLKYILVLILDY